MTHSASQRYLHDPHFKVLVDMMTAHIADAQYTPSEMRQAAILASIKYAEMNVRHAIVYDPKLEQALFDIDKMIEKSGAMK